MTQYSRTIQRSTAVIPHRATRLVAKDRLASERALMLARRHRLADAYRKPAVVVGPRPEAVRIEGHATTGGRMAVLFGRVLKGLMLASPGIALAALYVQRVLEIRLQPALSPGTPAETGIALMVAAIGYASWRMARATLDGRIGKSVATFLFMSLSVVVLVISLAFAVSAPGQLPA